MKLKVDLEDINQLYAMRAEAREQMKIYTPQITLLRELLYKLLKAHCEHWKRFTWADEQIALMEKLTKYPARHSGKKKRSDSSLYKMLETMSVEERQKLLEELEEEE